MNRVGTKGILDDSAKDVLLRQLIVEFDESHNSKAKVSYKDIFEFVKLKYDSNIIKFYPGYTWWKTKGKHLVDEYNELSKRKVAISETTDIDVFDIMEVIDRYYKDKESLIKYLLPYNELLERLASKINETQNKVQKLTEQLREKEERIALLELKNLNQVSLSDSLFYNLVSSEKELIKVMRTGTTASEVLNYSLTKTFENPAKYIEEFRERIVIQKVVNHEKKNNVVKLAIKENDIKKDDYDY